MGVGPKDVDWVIWGDALSVRVAGLGYEARRAVYAEVASARGVPVATAKRVARTAAAASLLARAAGMEVSEVRATMKAVDDLHALASRRPDVAASMARDVLSGVSGGNRALAALYGVKTLETGSVPEWAREAATLRAALDGLNTHGRAEAIRLASIERGANENVLRGGMRSLEALERMRAVERVADAEVNIAAASVMELDRILRLDEALGLGIRRDAILGRLSFHQLCRIRQTLSRGARPDDDMLARKEPHRGRTLKRRRDDLGGRVIGPAPAATIRGTDVADVVVSMVDRLGGDTVDTLRRALAVAVARAGGGRARRRAPPQAGGGR